MSLRPLVADALHSEYYAEQEPEEVGLGHDCDLCLCRADRILEVIAASVIEKAPVLDLLERWYKEAGVEGASRVDFETAELLRANGRDV